MGEERSLSSCSASSGALSNFSMPRERKLEQSQASKSTKNSCLLEIKIWVTLWKHTDWLDADWRQMECGMGSGG